MTHERRPTSRSSAPRSCSSASRRASTRSRRARTRGGDVDEAVDGLAEIAELAKEVEAEVQRARQAADAGA